MATPIIIFYLTIHIEDVSELIASHNSDKDKLKTSEEKVMELQEHIQSLRHELQVAHQYKVSLQEALVEANEQGTCTCIYV